MRVNNYTPAFTSPLSQIFTQFLAEGRGLGYAYNTKAASLSRFDIFVSKFPCEENVLTKEVVEAWCKKTGNEKTRNQEVRIILAKQIAKYMTAHGYSAYITPLTVKKNPGDKHVPYIFSDAELSDIFKESDKFVASKLTPTRHLVIPLLLRLLYGCGLRVSEALNLRESDIDFENGIIHIRNTKFYKSRKVIMSQSLRKRFIDYRNNLPVPLNTGAHFFPTKSGDAYSYRGVHSIFNELIQRAGIYYGERGNGPRIHDIRHTFAVHRLKKWTIEGAELSAMLPLLSTYLGHVDLDGTQHYLRLTADLFPHLTTLLEGKFGDIVPEIEWRDIHEEE